MFTCVPPRRSFFLTYMGLCMIRILNALMIQSQFDPDEYHQTLEPAYCEVFGTHENRNCAYTWEWTRRLLPNEPHSHNILLHFLQTSLQGPVRSYLSVLPTYVYYKILDYMKWDTFFLVSKGPLLLNAVLVAAPTDLSIWYMSHIIQQNWQDEYNHSHNTQNNTNVNVVSPPNIVGWSLACTLLSWFHGYALIRTYSNSMETVLLAVGMALISPELLGNRKQPEPANHYYRFRSALSFVLGGMSVAIRFTSLAAWIPMGLILSMRQTKGHSFRTRRIRWWHMVLFPCATCGVIGIWISLMTDRWFYGFWTIPFLGNLHFNVILGNGSLYGTHPFHWYWTAGVPAIAGVMLPFWVASFPLPFGGGTRTKPTKVKGPTDTVASNSKGGESLENDNHKEEGLLSWKSTLWWIIIPYATLHSFSAHKEFRFMMPILPLICLLAGYQMSIWIASAGEPHDGQQDDDVHGCPKPGHRRAILLGFFLFVLNIPHLLFLSLFHQRAALDVNRHIVDMIVQKELEQAQQSSSTTPRPNNHYSVHYWMGCHSTPLYSHLHTGGPRRPLIDTRTLDCSPSCRQSQNCESDLYHQDPVVFIRNRYNNLGGRGNSCEEEEDTQTFCELSTKPPDFVAIYAKEAHILQQDQLLESYTKVGSFLQGINGVHVSSFIKENDDALKDEEDKIYRRIPLLGGFVELSVDEMILFAKL